MLAILGAVNAISEKHCGIPSKIYCHKFYSVNKLKFYHCGQITFVLSSAVPQTVSVFKKRYFCLKSKLIEIASFTLVLS